MLILDDDASILDILGQHLRGEGYDCTLCTSPIEALESLKSESFALLLTDLKMPEMDGIEVVREIKAVDRDLAIIVVTAIIEVTNAIQALQAGADDYVIKPFNLSAISVSVSRALEKRTLIIENRRYQEELETRIHDATQDLAETNQQLRQSKEFLERLIDSTVDAIFTIDAEDHISMANRGAQQMLGLSQAEISGMAIGDLYIGGMEEAKYIRRVLRIDRPLQNFETELNHTSGKTVPVSMSISLVLDADGKVTSTLAVCKDITEQKRLERELKEMTIRDSLTGLYNQRHFYDRLDAEIERAKRQQRPLSLLVVDIDNFKKYNDSHGHLAGDKVLQEVGEVIRDCTREHVDLAFRYGGDEFTIVLPEAPEETARQIAERVRITFGEKPFDGLTMSVGLMTYEGEHSLRTFMQFTDSMMYDAKRAGGNRVYIYNSKNADSESSDA